MPRHLVTKPLYVGPSPKVLNAIRAEMKKRKFLPGDRRMPSVSSKLVAEPIRVPGFNEGIFYPPENLPRRATDLAPSRAVRSRPTVGKLRCLVLLADFSDNPGTRPAI
jgi:hypothetical protein